MDFLNTDSYGMGGGGRGAYDSGEMFLKFNYIRKGQRILKEGKDKIEPQHI